MMIFWVFFTFALWATSFPITKFSGTTGSVAFIVGSRMLLASFALFTWAYTRKKWSFKLSFSQFITLVLMGTIGYYVTNIFELYGLERISSSKASLIYGLSPFFAAGFSFFHLKERFSFKKLLGLCVGFLGVFPFFLSNSLSGMSLTISWGECAMLVATMSAMLGWVLLRHLVTNLKMPPLAANAWSMLFGALACLLHSAIADSWSPIPVVDPKGFFISVGLLVLISNLICNGMYSFLLKHFTVTMLSLAGMSSPFFAALWASVFFREPLVLEHLLSGLVMALGLWLVYQEELRLGYLKVSKASS